jgi:hypothetical protein
MQDQAQPPRTEEEHGAPFTPEAAHVFREHWDLFRSDSSTTRASTATRR